MDTIRNPIDFIGLVLPMDNLGLTRGNLKKPHTQETYASFTPELALQTLKEVNANFMNNLKINRNLLQQLNETLKEQYPFAVVLSCNDRGLKLN